MLVDLKHGKGSCKELLHTKASEIGSRRKGGKMLFAYVEGVGFYLVDR